MDDELDVRGGYSDSSEEVSDMQEHGNRVTAGGLIDLGDGRVTVASGNSETGLASPISYVSRKSAVDRTSFVTVNDSNQISDTDILLDDESKTNHIPYEFPPDKELHDSSADVKAQKRM